MKDRKELEAEATALFDGMSETTFTDDVKALADWAESLQREDRAEIERLRADVAQANRNYQEMGDLWNAAEERAEAAEAKLAEFHFDYVSSHKPEHCLDYCRAKEAALAAERAKTAKLVEALEEIAAEYPDMGAGVIADRALAAAKASE